jgi:hypothetical protein
MTAWTSWLAPFAEAAAKYVPSVGTLAATSIQKKTGMLSTLAAFVAVVESEIRATAACTSATYSGTRLTVAPTYGFPEAVDAAPEEVEVERPVVVEVRAVVVVVRAVVVVVRAVVRAVVVVV